MYKLFLIILFCIFSDCKENIDPKNSKNRFFRVNVETYLNIRKSHDINSQVIGKLFPGEIIKESNNSNLKINIEDKDWLHINKNGITGWINISYLEPIPNEYFEKELTGNFEEGYEASDSGTNIKETLKIIDDISCNYTKSFHFLDYAEHFEYQGDCFLIKNKIIFNSKSGIHKITPFEHADNYHKSLGINESIIKGISVEFEYYSDLKGYLHPKDYKLFLDGYYKFEEKYSRIIFSELQEKNKEYFKVWYLFNWKQQTAHNSTLTLRFGTSPSLGLRHIGFLSHVCIRKLRASP